MPRKVTLDSYEPRRRGLVASNYNHMYRKRHEDAGFPCIPVGKPASRSKEQRENKEKWTNLGDLSRHENASRKIRPVVKIPAGQKSCSRSRDVARRVVKIPRGTAVHVYTGYIIIVHDPLIRAVSNVRLEGPFYCSKKRKSLRSFVSSPLNCCL